MPWAGNRVAVTRADIRADVAVVLVDLAGGGTQRIVTRLIGDWHEQGIRVALIAPRVDDARWDTLPESTARLWFDAAIAPDTMTRGWRLVQQARAVWRITRHTRRSVRTSGARTVVSFLTGANLMTIVACAGLRRRVVVSERNDASRQPVSWPVRLGRRVLYRRASVVTANSTVALEALRGFVRDDRLVLTLNQVVMPERVADPAASRIIVTVGRLAAHKRHLLLIDAFAALVGRDHVNGAGWRLRIIGDGPERAALVASIESHGLAERIILTGHLEDVCDELAGAAVFVLSSAYEGTPNAMLEAMAHGLPVVVSDNLPGALEWVTAGIDGEVFPSGDRDALAATLHRLVVDPDARRRMGEAARRAVEPLAAPSVHDAWHDVLGLGHAEPGLAQD